MAKMFFLYNEQMKVLQRMLDKKEDSSYFVLYEKNGFADIAQYSRNYDSLRLVCVPVAELDPKMKVG